MVGLTSRVAIDASEILRENHLTCLKKGMQKTTTDKKTLERPMMHGILKMTLYSSLGRFCLQSLRGIGELGGIFFLDLRWTFEKNTRELLVFGEVLKTFDLVGFSIACKKSSKDSPVKRFWKKALWSFVLFFQRFFFNK